MKKAIISLFMVLFASTGLVAVPSVAGAADMYDACRYGGGGAFCNQRNTSITGRSGPIRTIVNILLMVIGFLAVIMIIWGGFLYATSAGNTEKLTRARNTIVYSVVGLAFAILAYGIVRFVETNLR